MRKKSRLNNLPVVLISILFTLPVYGHYEAESRSVNPDTKALISSPTFDVEASFELVYEASIGSRMLGELVAVRKFHPDSVIYRVTSGISAHIGFRLTQDYLLESVYRDGILARSELRNVVNDKVRANTTIRRSGETYFSSKDQELMLRVPPVKYSVAHLFFYEPVGIDQVFSENYADYIECRPEKNKRYNKYCIRLPDRTRVIYNYNNGVCESFEVKMVIFNVKYSLIKVNLLP